MTKLEKKFVDTGQGKIFYFSRFVSKNRPTAILLHGLSSNHTTWLHLMDILAENNINSLALDLRGHGFSDKTRVRSLYKFSRFRKDIEAIIKQEELDKVCLIGYSFGGYIGLDFAVGDSQRLASLILISANHVSPFKYAHLSFLSPICHTLLDVLAFTLLWQKRKHYHYFNQAKHYGYWGSTFMGLLTMPLSVNFWMLAQVFKMDYSQALEKITCPTLIMHGNNDNFVSEKEIDDMVKKIPSCQLARLNAGHFLASLYQEEVARNILNFLHKIK